MNAKEEFLEEIKGKQVLCSIIQQDIDYGFKYKTVACLKRRFTSDEFENFLKLLDFEYDSGYGTQELFGNIWYSDGTWSEREEYDGSEWWSHKHSPKIPKECI